MRNVSDHEAKVFLALKLASQNAKQPAGHWMTNTQITKSSTIAPRTARKHTQRLADLGLVELQKAYPAHKFRLLRLEELTDDEKKACWRALERVSRTVRAKKVDTSKNVASLEPKRERSKPRRAVEAPPKPADGRPLKTRARAA